MEQRYLPSTPQQRLQDLIKEHKTTQAKLAAQIGVAESTISRFINGTKDTLSLEQMISIARFFNVSTDFLLCITDVPDRKNYDLSELGLSAEAARNLYTGRTNPQVVSRLLENRRFAKLTNMIALYFDDTLASGFAAQNQMYQTVANMLLATGKEQPKAKEATYQAAQTISLNSTPAYQADLTNLQNQFMAVLQEIKKEIGVEKGKPLTKEVVQQMYSETMKGQDALHPSVSPEQVVDLILSSISGMELADQDSLAEVRQALLHLMQQMAKQDHEIKNE
ncbi:MAG: helix-turn-helix transcriptional regulator [Candidatus Faecousia sp.]|nr:helix-turn-helix transcriptional regulator [Candidatus Faecousia sp.]